jgi:hypothetical protein
MGQRLSSISMDSLSLLKLKIGLSFTIRCACFLIQHGECLAMDTPSEAQPFKLTLCSITMPQSTQRVLTKVPQSTQAEMTRAVDAAEDAYLNGWRDSSILSRQRIMMKWVHSSMIHSPYMLPRYHLARSLACLLVCCMSPRITRLNCNHVTSF